MRLSITFAALLLAVSVSATPVITSVSPSSGPAGGGTLVTLKGTGFSTCIICSPPLPPEVLFGGTPSPSVSLLDPTTIVAEAPPHAAGTVAVTVDQYDGKFTLENAFTFTGDIFAGLEPVLVPVFSRPVPGAFGSEFRTTVAAAHRGGGTEERILLFGVDTSCFLFSPVLGPLDPRPLLPYGQTIDVPTDCSDGPARVFWVQGGQAKYLAMNARVRDTSRSDLSHGTEIPVVRLPDFTEEWVKLLNVPVDPKFRNTLRIYALEPTDVLVMIDREEHILTLQPGEDAFEPAYAMFTNFPTGPGGPPAVPVSVRPLTPITSPPSRTIPIWAFITVTNNVTQEITTITPN